LSPADGFLAYVKVSALAGFVFSFPCTLSTALYFVFSGLKRVERKAIVMLLPIITVAFLIGASFGFYVVIPMALTFFKQFASSSLHPQLTLNHYLSFVSSMVLAFACVFELPVLLFVLSRLGLVQQAFLVSKRRHAYVLICVLSAVITPPDVLSLLMMSAPLLVLYELGCVVVGWVERRRKRSKESSMET
jgi:sec-independent protein translocase protein TatC